MRQVWQKSRSGRKAERCCYNMHTQCASLQQHTKYSYYKKSFYIMNYFKRSLYEYSYMERQDLKNYMLLYPRILCAHIYSDCRY